jgi:hypothetical protein
VTTRTISVQVLMDSEAVGGGVIEYVDEAVASTQEQYKDRCVAQALCADSTCYGNAVDFCYRDTLAKNQGGVEEAVIRVPVMVGDAQVGEAELEFTDAYAPVIQVAPQVAILALLSAVLALISIVGAVVGAISEALRKE